MATPSTAALTDTEWRKRARLLRSTAFALADATDTRATLNRLVSEIASFDGFRVGQAFLVDTAGARLTWCTAWHAGSTELQAFVDRSRSFDLSESASLPAMALAKRGTAIGNTLAMEAPRGPEAAAAGLRAGVAIPVVSHHEVVAVLEFHRAEPIAEEDSAVLLAETIAAHLGTLVSLQSSEAERRRLASEKEHLTAERERLVVERTHNHRAIEELVSFRSVLSDGDILQMPTRKVVQTCLGMLRKCLRTEAVGAYAIHSRSRSVERIALATISDAVQIPETDIDVAGRIAARGGESFEAAKLQLEGSGSPMLAALGLSLLVEGRPVGALVAFHDAPIPDTPYVRRLFQITADRIALRVSRAQIMDEAWRDRLRLEQLSQRLVSVQEAERRALSRDLHDEVAQAIAAIKFSMESTGELPEAMRMMLSRVIQQIRGLSQRLRPPLLDDMGLVPALEWHLKHFIDQTGVIVRFRVLGACGRYHPDKEIALFRVVQEALSNVARHSTARRARVLLRAEPEGLWIRVVDRGVGFDPATVPLSSTGIAGMEERLHSLQGRLTIRSRRGEGTEVTAHVPTFEREVGMSESITVVVADDHKILREALKALLESASFQVVGEASDGLETINVAERLKPNVLLLDVAMPGLGGVDVAKQVAKRSPTTKILMLSMYANDAYVNGAMKNGAAGYVLKDAGASELFHAIREVAQGRRYLSPQLEESGVADRDLTDAYDSLTMREREVLHLAAEGLTSAQIADRLSISPRTAETHRANSLRKLNIRGQTELVRYAIGRGILPAPV